MCIRDRMKNGGYYTAIRGKVSHSTPYQPYAWDADLTTGPTGRKLHIKDVPSYGECTLRGINAAKAAGKPFCLNINISDPHKPFWKPNDPHKVSRVFQPEEVPIPGFLFDHPDVRKELALYYSSVRRADDAVGSILQALTKSGHADETIVMFLSDHGMPLPFAKTQLYHHSTWTPWIIRWPGVTKAGSVNDSHMISAVDMLPTMLEMAGLRIPAGLDGSSFVSVIKGQEQKGREAVFKVYNENAGGNRHPIRGLQTKTHLYLFNPWSDGTNIFRTATNGTATYRLMKKLAPSDNKIAARLATMDHRTVEELYDIEKDPDCLNNLAGDVASQTIKSRLQARLQKFMEESNDHALPAFLKRDNPDALAAYMKKVQDESAKRRKGKQQNKPPGEKSPKKVS